jgi:hypothetical protein
VDVGKLFLPQYLLLFPSITMSVSSSPDKSYSPLAKDKSQRLSMTGVEEHGPNYWEDSYTIRTADIESTKTRKDKGKSMLH